MPDQKLMITATPSIYGAIKVFKHNGSKQNIHVKNEICWTIHPEILEYKQLLYVQS